MIGIDASNHLAKNYSKGKDIRLLVVEIFRQHFRAHEVRRANLLLDFRSAGYTA
jgi:hypothetical protein